MTAEKRLMPRAPIVLVLVAVLGLAGHRALAAAAGLVQFVAGQVQLDRGGRAQDVVKGAEVQVGDVLRSGPAATMLDRTPAGPSSRATYLLVDSSAALAAPIQP